MSGVRVPPCSLCASPPRGRLFFAGLAGTCGPQLRLVQAQLMASLPPGRPGSVPLPPVGPQAGPPPPSGSGAGRITSARGGSRRWSRSGWPQLSPAGGRAALLPAFARMGMACQPGLEPPGRAAALQARRLAGPCRWPSAAAERLGAGALLGQGRPGAAPAVAAAMAGRDRSRGARQDADRAPSGSGPQRRHGLAAAPGRSAVAQPSAGWSPACAAWALHDMTRRGVSRAPSRDPWRGCRRDPP